MRLAEQRDAQHHAPSYLLLDSFHLPSIVTLHKSASKNGQSGINSSFIADRSILIQSDADGVIRQLPLENPSITEKLVTFVGGRELP
jgi:hypothetical protein